MNKPAYFLFFFFILHVFCIDWWDDVITQEVEITVVVTYETWFQMMTNQEKQGDEILALQSIFENKFHRLNENQYEISIEFELLTPITLQFNDQSSTIEYLPPFTLIIQYDNDYPSVEPPSFILSCFFFSKSDLQKLCQKLDQYPFENEVCVYDWIDLIKHQIDDRLSLKMIDVSKEEDDPRALNGYTNETMGKVYQHLIDYNQEYADKQFATRLQRCLICTEVVAGIDCVRLHRCGHFYCRTCLNNYVKMTFDHGKFGEHLHCPQNECQQALLPTEIKEILQNDQLYKRYERLTLQRGLESMNDIIWCPRCQSAVLMENKNDNLCICSQCHYTFCRKCREVFHSQKMCPKDYLIEQLRIREERERVRLKKQREEVLAKMAKLKKEKKSDTEKNAVTEQYRRIVISLSEQDALLEEVLNAERTELLNIQHCPQCHAQIEKNGGCSHMRCSQCNSNFTWQTLPITSSSKTTLLNDNVDFESIKEELNREIDLVKKPPEEADQAKDEDMQVSIDNRSVIGSAILNRVRRCPSDHCQKIHVKTNQDNWIFCENCMRQFCFLCGHGINGAKHFEKKCQRCTPT